MQTTASGEVRTSSTGRASTVRGTVEFRPTGPRAASRLCSKGFFCPRTNDEIPCPEGHYCRAGFAAPLDCGSNNWMYSFWLCRDEN